jgi:hypothetical protein
MRTSKKKKPIRGRKKTTAREKKSAVRKKLASRSKARGKRKATRRKTTRRPAVSRKRGVAGSPVPSTSTTRGLGPDAGGQSGDTEGLSSIERADSESVEELLEEGQAFEAGIVSGVENARNADEGGVRTRQVPEDDVPQEYLDED